MYLTNKSLALFDINEQDHSDIEDLLETYYFESNELLSHLRVMKNNIDETYDTVSMMLNISRNRIMVSDLWIIFFDICLSFGTFVAGLFGMNLKNRYEED